MIEIKDKKKCSGCGVCANICPTNAIKMKYDEEGFLYPAVDEKKCIHCSKCDKACHMLCGVQTRSEYKPELYAAALKNKNDLQEVSSGGVFWALVQYMLEEEGVVYGVEQTDIFDVHHARGTTLEECRAFRRSKYIESNTGFCFQEVKKDLEEGKNVLFSGTGCQIAGLHTFLGKKYAGLITCEIVCHGVPSKKAFELYINEIQNEHKSKVKEICFRDKSKGWSNNQIFIRFLNGDVIKERSSKHLFHRGYLQGLFYRPSCAECPYAKISRIADITLADYWKYEGSLKEKNHDKGISLVVCSTEKGMDILKKSNKYLDLDKTTLEAALKSCRHLAHHPSIHKNRKKFFKALEQVGYKEAVTKYSKPSAYARVRGILSKKWRLIKQRFNIGE